MEIKNPKYERTAVRPDQYPARGLPEIALVGRSNVGKSSFINALFNVKNLARVAATPGKTREINFYNLNDRLYLVDLPGYGYAKVSKAKKAAWDEMIATYLQSREQLKLILMLVDIRHTPTEQDALMHQWLRQWGGSNLLVATKADKIGRGQIRDRLQDIRATLQMDGTEILIPFSNVTRENRNEIWNQIRVMLP